MRASRLKRATWRALVRHMRESQVVRDLVTGTRTRGFSSATILHGLRAGESPLGSGRETPRTGGVPSPRAGKATLKGGGPGRETPRSSWGSGRPGFKTPKAGGEMPKSGVRTLRRATSLVAVGAPPSPLGLRAISRFAAPQSGGRRLRETEERATLPTGQSRRGALTKGGQDAVSRDEKVLQKMDADGTEESSPRGRAAERCLNRGESAGVTGNAIQTAGGEGRVGAMSVGRLERKGSSVTSAEVGRHAMTSAETGLKLSHPSTDQRSERHQGFRGRTRKRGAGCSGRARVGTETLHGKVH